MSRRIRLTNAEWDAVSGAAKRRVADLAAAVADGHDADDAEREVAALARSLDKIADMMRPIRRPRGPSSNGPNSPTVDARSQPPAATIEGA
ncbi:MAG: hypothetical protein JWN61_1752 [Pseudonocardiales bacterium]|nr:hypothetical protein [Jatrophihabitantaceae bacterium]MCW2603617.1 hypothetical protein [Pseudonocardiales bacterium]